MKRILKISLLVLIVALGTGCTTGYWVDRGRDAADVFTFSYGGVGGARCRVGPLHTGMIVSIGTIGLRGGDYQAMRGHDGGEMELLLLPFTSGEVGKKHWVFAEEAFEPSGGRGKGFVAYSKVPFLTTSLKNSYGVSTWWLPYLTQIEIQAGLGFVPRIGFNPGELLDLLLGFAGIDIYNDDLERRKQEIEQADSDPDGPNP